MDGWTDSSQLSLTFTSPLFSIIRLHTHSYSNNLPSSYFYFFRQAGRPAPDSQFKVWYHIKTWTIDYLSLKWVGRLLGMPAYHWSGFYWLLVFSKINCCFIIKQETFGNWWISREYPQLQQSWVGKLEQKFWSFFGYSSFPSEPLILR